MKIKMFLTAALTVLSITNLQAASVTITGSAAASFMQKDLRYTFTPAEIITTESGTVLRLNGGFNGKPASCDFSLANENDTVNVGVQAPVKCTYDDGK